ncbi:hypothetical protein [Vibrio penaeicida]|uniref:Uncharacterized protein n=2 Tax=Vibrio penaeicida TaxID=104609 RepID=A0AAV5NLI7_9VIBR|nr:hypothetical protein [Vibrio penaeicida]RTZ20332.1 hypothetical protein EKN09_24625 [Vibrio penaeicida]GLQ71129.1 hypothetical protein GCM10007932_04890 [Vibrio penaeicida]
MTNAPSDFAIVQREKLLISYQALKGLVLKNNELCVFYSKRMQDEINKFFLENPRIKISYEKEFKNSVSPITLEPRDLHRTAKTVKMDDPIQVKVIRARVLIQLRNKNFPTKQDVIWNKDTKEYFDAEFQKGRLGLSAEQSKYVSKIIQDVNYFNAMFIEHYDQLHNVKTLLERNIDLLEGMYD